ncbi:MAG: glycosyltransferase [Ignavibacteria bacterium]
MLDLFFYIVLSVQSFLLLIVIYNFLSDINLRRQKNANSFNDKISILIPFRNEEKNIRGCLKSVIQQNLKNFEIICLNDNSEDNTRELLLEFSKLYDKIRIIDGKPLPKNWTGKNWSCSQLAENSNGEYLVFLDADVRLNKDAIISALRKMKELNLNMLSIFPTQKMNSLSEYLIVPSMNWLLLNFLPLNFVYKFSHPSFVAANGQFIVFDIKTYFLIGGHQSVKDKFVEDMELARLLKKKKFKIATMLGGDLIFAKMYESSFDSINGFSKNFFPGFNTSYLNFSMFLVFIFLMFIFPFLLSLFYWKFIFIVGLIYIQKILISLKSHQNVILNFLLVPLQLILVIFVGIRSMIYTKKGKLQWKGRILRN